jgi:hypothetical protein
MEVGGECEGRVGETEFADPLQGNRRAMTAKTAIERAANARCGISPPVPWPIGTVG